MIALILANLVLISLAFVLARRSTRTTSLLKHWALLEFVWIGFLSTFFLFLLLDVAEATQSDKSWIDLIHPETALLFLLTIFFVLIHLILTGWAVKKIFRKSAGE